MRLLPALTSRYKPLTRPPKEHPMNLPASALGTDASAARLAAAERTRAVTGPRCRGLVGRSVASLVVTGIAALGLSATAALADVCPNAALRARNQSSALPDCRAYEMVTPAFKEGFTSVDAPTYTDDVVAFRSNGNFAGNGLGATVNQYVARRSATGWETTSPQPSGPDYGADISSGAEALSADLGSSLWEMRRFDQPTDLVDYYIHAPDGAFIRIGPGVNPATAPPSSPGSAPANGPELLPSVSDDLSHILFRVLAFQAFPGDTTVDALSLYEYVGTGNERPRLVGVDNAGHLISSAGTCSGGLSNDGRVAFFAPACAGNVWARIDGTTSIEMSASECTRAPSSPAGGCTGSDDAQMVGKAADGSRAFFTTTKQLVNGDTDPTTDIYACDIPAGTPTPIVPSNPCAALREVSGAAAGANVQNVARVSRDGSSVYFIAQGVLAANLGVTDAAPVAGENNLYVWQKNAEHPSGATTFIARVDGVGATAATDDGRYFAFSTPTPLVTTGPGADTDATDDVYRYDARSGAILRLSTSTSGDGGNDPSTGVLFRGDFGRTRAMAADGRTVLFETSEQLSPSDTDLASDVYEWRDGHLSQITSGGAKESAISAAGNDIFFLSSQPLTDADGDTNFDIYDARSGGGFAIGESASCGESDCRARPSAPPTLATPPPASAPGAGGVSDVDPVFALKKVTVAQRKQLARAGQVTLTVSINTPATLTATASAALGGRSVGVGSTRRVLPVAGTFKLKLNLTQKARRQLTTRGRLTVKITVRDSKVALPQSTTLRLTHVKTRSSLGKQATSASEKSHS
jgi:hypothetical protein